MFEDWPTFFTFTGTIVVSVVGGIVSILVARAQSKAQVKAEEVKSNAPEWDLFTTNLMKHIEDQQTEIKNNKDEIGKLRDVMNRLDERSRSLEERLQESTRQYWQAILSLRRVFEGHPETVETAELTNAVHSDVFKG